MKRNSSPIVLAACGLVLLTSCSSKAPAPLAAKPTTSDLAMATSPTPEVRARLEAHAAHAIISTQGIASTEAARSILAKGGNIIDAAIAASFAIGVERPHSTGIGGGGFLLYREAATSKVYALDFRERAPLKASRDMFLNRKGDVIEHASSEGVRAIATPGFLQGMVELHRKFGKLPLNEVLEPAAQLAEDGFAVYPNLANAIRGKRALLARYPESRKIFLHPDGTPYAVGEKLVQKDLARTIRWLGSTALDEWSISQFDSRIIRESKRLHGLINEADFKRYSTRWLEPVVGTYHDYQVISMPPPSSGGTILLEALNTLENVNLADESPQSTQSTHLIASALQLAFADRAQYLGDPDYTHVPVAELTSKRYGLRQSQRIDRSRHLPSTGIGAGDPNWAESNSTTHFSIMDEAGNVVSTTQTINGHFGSGITLPGTGVVLNNEMDDFSEKPGVGNIYGATGGKANEIAPGKTPLSSMTPTIVLRGPKPVLALGAPGGTRIISCVLQVLLNYVDYKLPLFESVNAIRIHDQWIPDELLIDAPGPKPSVIEALRQMGYSSLQVAPDAVECRVMAVAHEATGLIGVSDPRDNGASAGL